MTNTLEISYKEIVDEKLKAEYFIYLSSLKGAKFYWDFKSSTISICWTIAEEIRKLILASRKIFGRQVTFFIDNTLVSEKKPLLEDSNVKDDGIEVPEETEEESSNKAPEDDIRGEVVEVPEETEEESSNKAPEDDIKGEIIEVPEETEEESSNKAPEDDTKGEIIEVPEETEEESSNKAPEDDTKGEIIEVPEEIEEESSNKASEDDAIEVPEESVKVLSEEEKALRAPERVKYLKEVFFKDFTLPSLSAKSDYTTAVFNRCTSLGIKNQEMIATLVYAGIKNSEKDIYASVQKNFRSKNPVYVQAVARKSYLKWLEENHCEFFKKYPESTLMDFVNAFRAEDKML